MTYLKPRSMKREVVLIACVLVPSIASGQDLVLDGQRIPLDTKATVSIDPATRDIIVQSATGNLVCSEPGSEPPTVSDISLTSSAIVEGTTQSIGVVYTTSEAEGCSGSGSLEIENFTDWAQTQPLQSPNGEATFSAGALSPGSYDVSLSCTNAGGTTFSDPAVLTVQSQDVPSSCTDTPPPVGTSRDSAILFRDDAVTNTFFSVLGTFPGGAGNDIFIEGDQYAALSFNSGDSPDGITGGEINSSKAQNPFGTMVITISTCPGDFGPHLDETNCRNLVTSASGSLRWRYSDLSFLGSCELQRNTDYYLNVMPATSLPSNGSPEWNCIESSTGCGSRLSASGRFD